MTQHRKLDADTQATAAQAAKSGPPELRQKLELYAAVILGSVFGSVLRALASLAFQDCCGTGFSWGTLFVNVTGSFAIGCYAALTGPDGRLFAGPRQRQFVTTGICGGYTTFSMFSLETLWLWQMGHAGAAGFNVGISVITWLGAVWLGYRLAMYFNRRERA